MNRNTIFYVANCHTCAKELHYELPYDHQCYYCHLTFCRQCDDRGDHLRWEEVKGEDRYMCLPCQKKYADKYSK
jgi:hypothetical protein